MHRLARRCPPAPALLLAALLLAALAARPAAQQAPEPAPRTAQPRPPAAAPAPAPAPQGDAAAGPLVLAPGAHVCLLGNALAERMQHDGWFETLLHARHPRHRLVVRNLAYAGDEVALRLRCDGFGTPDEHLRRCGADVVLAFFGYNESFAGAAGLASFRAELADFVRRTRRQRYGGGRPAEVVLFSPLAHEDLRDPNLPDGSANNHRLALYTAAMADVAEASGAHFVDLYHPTLRLYAQSVEPLTINGIHLNDLGNRLVAQVAVAGMFGSPPGGGTDGSERAGSTGSAGTAGSAGSTGRDPAASGSASAGASNAAADARAGGGAARSGRRAAIDATADLAALEQLRAAVLDKSEQWFLRYRTVDGYSIYGGRGELAFTDGQTNREVAERELEVLDAMTAARDRAIWAVAAGEPRPAIDDSATPPFLEVKTNQPGPEPDGSYPFLDAEASLAAMRVREGMAVNLFASEAEFPELVNPVQLAFDTQGRLWVAVWPTYPHAKPKQPRDDKLLILEDGDGDGRADRCTAFAADLHCPTGFELYGGGVYVAQPPDLWFLRDRDGDDVADERTRVLHGLGSADTHHAANSFVLGPGGDLYFQEGTFHHSQIETPHGPPLRVANGAVFRFEPRTHRVEAYVSYGFANPHGHAIDRWGQGFITDGTGAVPYWAAAFSGHVEFPAKHAAAPALYQPRARPCGGTTILSGAHFPAELQGDWLVANCIGFRGILSYRLRDDGAGFAADETEPIVSSSDPNFRPVDLEVGGDGALYFLDWHNPLIGHMQHHLRDPSRDAAHGRIYRVTCPGRPLPPPPAIAGQPIAELLRLLESREDRVRYRARIELSARPTAAVLGAVRAWVEGLDPAAPDLQHHLLEALWVHQLHNTADEPLLRRLLHSPEPRARAAAVRVLCAWRDRVSDVLELLAEAAGDPHPRVRLEAVRACSFLPSAAAAEAALRAAAHPGDRFLDYALAETLRALQPHWLAALRAGQPLCRDNAAGLRALLDAVSDPVLLELPRSEPVGAALLRRPGVDAAALRAALDSLAEARGSTALRQLLAALQPPAQRATERAAGSGDASPPLSPPPRADAAQPQADAPQPLANAESLAALLAAWDPEALAQHRDELVALATHSADGAVRAGAYAAWIAADGGPQRCYRHAARTVGGLCDLLRGVPLLADAAQRAAIYPLVRPLLHGLPEPLAADDAAARPADGDAAREVQRWALRALGAVEGHDAERFADLAALVADPRCREAAVAALLRIPPAARPPGTVADLARQLAELAAETPYAARGRPPFTALLELGRQLAAALPAADGALLARQLADLDLLVVQVRAVPGMMKWDIDRFEAVAGKPVRIAFTNEDAMPHNLLIGAPGSLEALGALADAMATDPQGFAKGFVPDSDKVLFATGLVYPGQRTAIEFVAPDAPGDYPFVCTFPGHWRTMHGIMHVAARR